MSKLPEPRAILGGTFDPVHTAHVNCAEEVRVTMGLKELYLLPAGQPPHRQAPTASNEQRLAMLQLAVTGFPHLKIDTRELDRNGPSFMVDTLRELRVAFPSAPLVLVVGQDAANQLHKWHQWQSLFDLAHIVIMTRPGSSAHYRGQLLDEIQQRSCADVQTLLQSSAGGVLALDVKAMDVCATTVKSTIGLGRSPGDMLPDAVMNYIKKNGIYQPLQS